MYTTILYTTYGKRGSFISTHLLQFHVHLIITRLVLQEGWTDYSHTDIFCVLVLSSVPAPCTGNISFPPQSLPKLRSIAQPLWMIFLHNELASHCVQQEVPHWLLFTLHGVTYTWWRILPFSVTCIAKSIIMMETSLKIDHKIYLFINVYFIVSL